MQILHPIPDPLLPDAAALWRGTFGLFGWPRRIQGDHGLVALDGAGRICGVMGVRDALGGLARSGPPLPEWLFRPAPATADLVIDGLIVLRRRQGTGSALLAHAVVLARLRGHPGLRAEVRAANAGALAFYRAAGFQAQGQGRFGPPWWGPVHLLHRPV